MSRPFIPAPKTASYELFYQFGSYFMENIFHVQSDIDFTDAMLIEGATKICLWDTAYFRGFRINGCNLVNIRAKALHAPDAPIRDFLDGGNHLGSLGGAPLPANATYVTSLRTGLAGRSARGRWYWVGLSTSHTTGAYQVSAGTATTYQTYLWTLYGELGWGGLTHPQDWVICSYRHDKAWRAEAVNYHVISMINTDLNLDSQRRRLAGRGRV